MYGDDPERLARRGREVPKVRRNDRLRLAMDCRRQNVPVLRMIRTLRDQMFIAFDEGLGKVRIDRGSPRCDQLRRPRKLVRLHPLNLVEDFIGPLRRIERWVLSEPQ